MVSAGGLNPSNASWVESLEFEQREIAELWRFAVTSYLWKADQNGLLRPSATPNEFADLVLSQTQRRWNIHITRRMTKQHFLGYAGRYIRRLPLSQRRILRVSGEEVVYQSKDTRTNVLLEARCTPTAFVDLLSQHVPDHYRDSMRYFGLLRSEQLQSVFLILGQKRRSRPPRLGWRSSLLRDFQTDPLRDSQGQTMHWVRRIRPGMA